jgi:hypothetical protein
MSWHYSKARLFFILLYMELNKLCPVESVNYIEKYNTDGEMIMCM